MTITLNGTTGITTPDVNVTAQSSNIVTTGNITAVDATLSGGVYVGGTAAANYLDDYEEGTWTPTITGDVTAGSHSNVSRVGKYTKVGNVVHAEGYYYGTSGTGSGQMIIGGLPFSVGSATLAHCVIQYNAGLDLPTGTNTPIWVPAGNTTAGSVRCNSDSTGTYVAMPYPTAPNYVRVCITYITS